MCRTPPGFWFDPAVSVESSWWAFFFPALYWSFLLTVHLDPGPPRFQHPVAACGSLLVCEQCRLNHWLWEMPSKLHRPRGSLENAWEEWAWFVGELWIQHYEFSSEGHSPLVSFHVSGDELHLDHPSVPFGEGNVTLLQYSCLENPVDGGAWWAAVCGVAKSWTWPSDFTFTFHFHALEEEMATHSSVLGWRIPWTEEPGGLPSMGLHRVGHHWSDLATAVAARNYISV